uniref:Ubiquitin-like protease family profile domain-containing protein n=1 Tax=Brassica oleracea var. oleracea TaxID=109376 RepID=A0A0D3D9T1_BRAOL
MVSARLVDCPDSPDVQQSKSIPQMMFAAGEEPVGVRVLTYQSSGAIERILDTLHEEEIDFIKAYAFGKIVEIAEKPVFSGRFARYLLSRQLKTKKKHEAWFRFAGHPVRFSLREFALVTGLPCGKFPKRSKQKLRKTIAEKPYWPSLFGKSDVVTVASVLKMLRRRTVTDKDIRIKFSCLAILESVLLPTSLKMKICREHAEAIKDIDEFFAYPWGRLAFYLLMCSIKERDEVALSQDNIAVKGFALALQLVLVEVVPALTEVVQETCSSSESDSEDDGLDPGVDKIHVLALCFQVVVTSILEDLERRLDDSALTWSDEEDDDTVDNMVDLINANHSFQLSLYVGGLTKADVDRMREASPPATKAKRSRKHLKNPLSDDQTSIASFVIGKVQPQLDVMGNTIKQSSSTLASIEGTVITRVESVLKKFKAECLGAVESMVAVLCKDYTRHPNGSGVNAGGSQNAASASGIVKSPVEQANDNTINNVMQNISAYSTPPASPHNSHLIQITRVLPCLPKVRIIVGRRTFVNLCVINVAGLSVSSRELLLMAERPRLLSSKVVDILIRLVRYVVSGQPCTEGVNRYEFLDTKFGASIVRNYPKFSMSKKKDSYPFPKGLMDYFGNKGVSSTYPIRYYIPFLIEKKHWIGVCFDTSKGHLHVFDSNMSFTKEATMARNLTPLLQMLP